MPLGQLATTSRYSAKVSQVQSIPASIASAAMSSARSRLRTTRCFWSRRHGASVKPQLPMITVVTPCQHEHVPSGSHATCASMCVCPSMKPGATTSPRASSSSRPRSGMRPMRAMRPSRTPTSARNAANPEPSTTSPPRITRSYMIGPPPFSIRAAAHHVVAGPGVGHEPDAPSGPRSSVRASRLLSAHAPDVLVGQAEAPERFVGVLTGPGPEVADAAGRLAELDRDAELPHLAGGRVLGLDDHAPVEDLRVAHHLLDVVDLAHADIVPDEDLEPVVAVARPDDRLDRRTRRRLLGVRRADEMVRLAREPREVRPADGLAEVLPEPGLGAPDRQQLAVARLVDRVVGVGAPERAFPAARRGAVREEEAHVGGGR